jgi:hypothetical protein
MGPPFQLPNVGVIVGVRVVLNEVQQPVRVGVGVDEVIIVGLKNVAVNVGVNVFVTVVLGN